MLIVEPTVHRDARGWFMETFNSAWFEKHGLPVHFEQDNHSRSRRGVVRGLHYQLREPQGKLVRCVRGEIFDVAVDIRRGSKTFGVWDGVKLSEENQLMLWIPAQFAHGFAVLSDTAEIVYKCTTLWDRESDRTILWNDPQIGIEWQVDEALVSEKDQRGATLAAAEVFHA